MSAVSTWSTTASLNNSAAPNGSPEGMSAASVNNSIREIMAAVKVFYDTLITSGGTFLFSDGSSGATASVAGDTFIIESDDVNTGVSILGADTSAISFILGNVTTPDSVFLSWWKSSLEFTIATRVTGGEIDFYTDDTVKTLVMTSSQDVHIGGDFTPSGRLHVDQESATGAKPVLLLDQADLSEEFLRFDSAIATGNPIEAVAAKTLTPTHFVRVNYNGTDAYMQLGTIA